MLLTIVAVAVTPAEEAEAQSLPSLFFGSLVGAAIEDGRGYDVVIRNAGNIGSNLTVNYTLGGTATCGVDYTIPGANCGAMTGSFRIDAGARSGGGRGLRITYLEDAVSDHQETLIVTLVAGSGYRVGTSAITVTIYENSGRATFMTSGTPTVGSTLSSRKVCADPDGEGTISYRWMRSDRVSGSKHIISGAGATSATYTPTSADTGKYVTLRVSYVDSGGLETQLFTSPIGPIGEETNNKVQFSRDSYNVREGDLLRPTLVFDKPTADERAFEVAFYNCNTELGPRGDVEATRYSDGDYFNSVAATHRVTVPVGATRHTFSLPVPLDAEIEEAESFVLGFRDVPSGFGIGAQNDAHVQITNVSVVPENWSLKPAAVNAGDQFRLLFKTENERNATSGNIGDYDTFVRNRISSSTHGHADIRQYAPTFRVVGSTDTVDAAWHTATGIVVNGEPSHTPFSHRINWLNGVKIADDYNDFWDGTWDNGAQDMGRNANGATPTNNRGPNTGTQTGTAHATAGVKHQFYLGHNGFARWGGRMANRNPISQGNIAVSSNNVYLGLSGIFMPLNVSAANPLVTIESTQTTVEEGTGITYTLRAFPAPSSPTTVNVKVTEAIDGVFNFVQPGSQGATTVDIPTSGVAEFMVNTDDDGVGEPDGEVTVSIGAGAGYRTVTAYDTVMTAVTSDDEANTLSASVMLGDGTNGPAQTGANVDFAFSIATERERSELRGIRTQLAWSGDVLSPRSDHRPATWDRYKINPEWKPDGSAKVNHRGVYVRPWLENSILVGDSSFNLRVHVKNRAEAGGNVGNGWIAMRVAGGAGYEVSPDDWACMPVGGGACPSAWPGVPAASVRFLDGGSVMSGDDARFRVSVTPAPGAGETRRVYLKTWEVFINGIDPPLRRGERKVQFEAYTHVDVGSGGSADIALPTKIFREDPVNITGREYWVEVQQDVAYSVGGVNPVKVETTVFDPAAAACWYGHSHHAARMITVDGALVFAPAGLGVSDCLTKDELEQQSSGFRVWTSCRVDYGHRHHPYSDSRGGTHSHHSHSPYLLRGNGNCTDPRPQTLGQDSQGRQQQDDPFPDPGAVGFSEVTAGTMTLSWPQREVDHYLVYWGENVENSDVQSARVDVGTLSYTITGLEADTEYAVIVYSQDYDEVTPTAYQRTAAAAPPSCDPSTASAAIRRARAAFAWHVSYGSDAALFWRILDTLGADNMPAKPSGVTVETVTAQYVKDYSSGRGWAGWAPIVEALEDCEASTSTDTAETVVPPPPPTPEVSISAGSGVTEGGDATFTITADPAPAAPLTVTVAVSQSGDYGVTPATRTVTVPTSGAVTLTVATTNDTTDEPDGSVTVTVDAGSGYAVSATAGTATVAVADDDDPPPPSSKPSISVGDATAGEGDGAVEFTVTLSAASTAAVTVYYAANPGTAMPYADYLPEWGRVTFAAGDTAKTVRVSLIDDRTDGEGDETFVLKLILSDTAHATLADHQAQGTITDND